MAAPQGIIRTLRRFLGQDPQLGSGLFPIGQGGGAQGIFYAQSWEFQKLWSTVFANPTGYRCVQAIEANFSRPPWMIMPFNKPWPQHGQEESIDEHPILDLLNQPYTDPSGRMSGTTMQRTIARDLELCGKSFWVKIPNGSGPTPAALRRLPAQRVTVVGNQDDELLGFVYTDRAGQRSAILPENVIYLRYPHPERIYDGIAPALMAAMGAETDTAGARFNRDLLHNDGAIPGYLVVQNMTPQQFAEWKQQWESGAQPGRVRFMSGDQASYVKVGMSNQELTYAELRDASQDDIMRSFGVPRAVALDVSHETYANAEQEKAIFMQQNILPKWILVADELTQQLGEEQNIRICFDLGGIEEMQGSSDKFVSRSTQLLGWKVITINEVRRDLGLPDVEWGDEPDAPIQPMSAVPLQPGGEEAPPAPPQNTGSSAPAARLPAPAQAAATVPSAHGIGPTVYEMLHQTYPATVLQWVREVVWKYDPAVPLENIVMNRRPGGRDPKKVDAIAEKVKSDDRMEPVILVQTPNQGLKIADGYHRTLGYQHAGRSHIPAYIGTVTSDEGPWDREMHDQKLNAMLTGYAVADGLTDEGALKDLELGSNSGKVKDTSVPEGNVGDVRARHLIRWYNEGADGQIPWGAPGDFDACVRVAGKHVRDPKGFCAERHHDALGIWPATHAKEVRGAEGKK